MPHPDRLPDLFLDRILGRIEVPELLRAAGLRLVTLAGVVAGRLFLGAASAVA